MKRIFVAGPICSILALLALTPALTRITSAASAGMSAPPDTNGVNGFAICGTFDPTSSYYVPGDPVYISDMFQVSVDSPNYELAFKNFLKQKYGWNKYVACSVSYTRDGATKTFGEKLKQAGAKLVRTGWTLASAGASAGTGVAAGAGSSSAPAVAPDRAAGSSYWVCRVSGDDGKDYNSDIFRGSDAGFATFPAVYGQFVQSKYKVKFQGSPTCTDYGVLGQQQAKDALKGYASYSTGVMTGWKYGTTGIGDSSPAGSPQAAISSNTAQGAVAYWVCSLSYYSKTYVSDVIPVGSAEADGAMGRLYRGFRSFLSAKYKLPPTGGSGNCLPAGTAAQADSIAHRMISPGSGPAGVATGWKPGAAPASGQGDDQPNGELGPDGQVIGGTASGVLTAYSCYAQTVPAGAHRQTSYITAPFGSAQPQRWITFWFSQYIHQTYNIPANVARFTIDCGSLGNKTPAQQQATVNANITSWKQHDNDVVPVNWAPTQTPTPGISVAQLNLMTGQMTTGGIGSNLPPTSNPAGSVVLCGLPGLDGKQYSSAIFPAGNHPRADFDRAFENYLATRFGNGKVMGDATCQIVTPAHAHAISQQWKKELAALSTPFVETGWTYTGPEAGPVQSASTSPPGYVLCTTNRSSDNKAYASAIFKGGSEEHLAIEQAFLTYLATKYGPNVPHNTSCPKRAYLADAQSYLYAMKNQAPGAGIKVVETGWTYNGGEVAPSSGGGSASEQAAASGGQYVLCYSDTHEASFYLSASFHIDVPPPPDPHSTQTDNGRSANALNEFKTDFLAFLKKQYGFRVASAYPVYCDGDATSGGPDERRQRLHRRFPQLKMIETGWKPGAAPSPAAASAPAAAVNPYASVGGVYTGTYACAKGPIDMTLTLALSESSILSGTMTFYLPPGSHTKAYTFSLGGPLNQTSGSFNLRPMKWETPAPPNYVLVGLIGTANPPTGRLSGKVDYSGCGTFEAMKGRED